MKLHMNRGDQMPYDFRRAFHMPNEEGYSIQIICTDFVKMISKKAEQIKNKLEKRELHTE